jgi:hypothetical protein
MDWSRLIRAKDAEDIKPEIREICCDSIMFFDDGTYDQVTCEKYGNRSEYTTYGNIFDRNLSDCFAFKRNGKCCLENYMK